jgi:phenylalanyl-tRNA synthetase alpha chain
MTQRGQIHPGTVAAVDPQALETDALAALDTAATSDDVERVRIEYLGRKSPLKLALREVRDRETGMALNTLRERLEKAFDAREKELGRAELDRRLTEERIDITMPGTPVPRGQLHLITQIRREFEDIFLGLGYTVVDGREVETTRYNFDGLNFPESHPARSTLHSFFLDDETVLRTETSPSQIRTMEAQEPPVYIVSLGRVYRRDTADATHTAVFHQVEGLAVDEGITLADLTGTLDFLLKALFGKQRRTEFRTHYFPFTEPSIEAYVSCHVCDGAGCPVCRHSGWIEVGGAGMVDPKLFEFVGYDPERYSGFAFGWGLERIAMLRHEFPDLRELWRNDLRFARQF